MKKLKPALVFSFLGIATFASLVGTVSGTLAWYAYNSRVTLSYSGTSVENSVQLQIGLACPDVMTDEDFLDVMEDPEDLGDGLYYYFAPMGYGLSPTVINAYLAKFEYATNELEPITSGYFDPTIHTTGFSPKAAPTAENPSIITAAKKKNYLKLPFIFRASRSKSNTPEYVKNAEIWLTDAKAAASSTTGGNVYKAMRIFFDRDNTDYNNKDFILNPSASSAGETKVGGFLDLSMDGYYDFDNNKEVVYGEWDTSADPTDYLSANKYSVPATEAPYYDLNGTGEVVDSGNTFNARHHKDVYYYDSEVIGEIPFRTAKYESLSSIKPVRDASGKLSNPEGKVTSVCKTKDDYIGRVDAYVWLEGWDFNVVDKEQHHAFDLGLTFEINRAS